MLRDDERRKIDSVLSQGSQPIEVGYHSPLPGAQSPFSEDLQALAEALAETGPNISLKEGEVGRPPARPAMSLTAEGFGTIHYLAVPSGLEFPPFLSALSGLSRAKTPMPEYKETSLYPKIKETLASLDSPATIHLFIGSSCPHCPNAVRETLLTCLASARIEVAIIDVQRFPELAKELQIKSVPFSLLDGNLSWTGVKSAKDIAAHILSRNLEEYGQAAFESLIESGRLSRAALELQRPLGAKFFIDTWKKSTMSSRIGLLLVAEQALETNPRILDSGAQFLIDLLNTADAALRGDTADLLGRIGLKEAIPALEKLRNDPNPDVAEIASEAIDELKNV